MAFPPNIWNQLKNLSKDDLISALEKDGWKLSPMSGGSEREYIKEGSQRRRIVIHYHTRGETCGRKLLKGLLEDIEWTETDLHRLKLVK